MDVGLDLSLSRIHEQGITSQAGEAISSKEIKYRYGLLRDAVAAITIEDIARGSATQPSEDEALYTTQVKYRYQLKDDPTWHTINGHVTLHLMPSEYAPSWNVTRMEGVGLML
jgi:hypothetical protein